MRKPDGIPGEDAIKPTNRMSTSGIDSLSPSSSSPPPPIDSTFGASSTKRPSQPDFMRRKSVLPKAGGRASTWVDLTEEEDEMDTETALDLPPLPTGWEGGHRPPYSSTSSTESEATSSPTPAVAILPPIPETTRISPRKNGKTPYTTLKAGLLSRPSTANVGKRPALADLADSNDRLQAGRGVGSGKTGQKEVLKTGQIVGGR